MRSQPEMQPLPELAPPKLPEKSVADLLKDIQENGVNGEDINDLQALLEQVQTIEQNFTKERSEIQADVQTQLYSLHTSLKESFKASLDDGYTLKSAEDYASLRIMLQLINPSYKVDAITLD